MPTRKLDATDAFVVLDLEGADRAVGAARLAPKILRDGAALLARSVTYQYASFGWRVSGASAGINAKPDGRDEAIAAFLGELGPAAEGPELVLEPAKGLPADSLDALLASTPPVFRSDRDRLRGRGAAAAAAAVLGAWEGRSVALESFDPVSRAFAEAVVAAGGTLAAVGTPAGVVVAGPDGLAPDALAAAGTDAEALGALGRLDADASLFEVEADAVTAGSKAGVVDHLVAPRLRASVLVPVGPAPVTARGLAEAGRVGCRVLPDFLALGGAAVASEAGADEALEAVEARTIEAVTAAVHEVADHPEGLYLGACERAEAFLATWQDTLPFGRPLA